MDESNVRERRNDYNYSITLNAIIDLNGIILDLIETGNESKDLLFIENQLNVIRKLNLICTNLLGAKL
jgi:hypothetical protein